MKKPPASHPVDYFVPNFGRDKDISNTWNSIDWAEKRLKHKFNPTLKKDLPKPDPPVLYHDETSALDEDVISSLEHASQAE